MRDLLFLTVRLVGLIGEGEEEQWLPWEELTALQSMRPRKVFRKTPIS